MESYKLQIEMVHHWLLIIIMHSTIEHSDQEEKLFPLIE